MKLCSARSVWPRRHQLTPRGRTTWEQWWEQRWNDNYEDYTRRMAKEKAHESQ